ncbi:MAG: hypothetical protein AABY22_34230 [Nanoarchaeota archaeon]
MSGECDKCGEHPLECKCKYIVEELEELLHIQMMNGNWNYDPYMHGMTNGMILFLSLMKGEVPKFIDAPEKWVSENREEFFGRQVEIKDEP